MLSERACYNALNLELLSNYHALSDRRRRFKNWTEAWQSEPGTLDPEKSLSALGEAGIRLILREEPGFPELLREMPLPPWGIYAKGKLSKIEEQCLAVVGTRRASGSGRALAKEFASRLGRAGLLIVSGLAFGIDAAAHEGALEAGGPTIAVIAGGLDNISPRTNRQLAERISDKGAIITEYPLGTEPLAHRFLERNRIIAGLSRGALIIEAPLRSGSLSTARFALESNRDVFVLPGPARDPNFAGSNQLIRKGAELVTCPEEILQSLGMEPAKIEVHSAEESPEMASILKALRASGQPLNIDKIAELTNLNIQTVSQVLTLLILEDLVRETSQGYCTRNS